MDSERQRGWRDGDSMKGGGWAGVWGKKEVRRDLHGLLEVKMLAESPLPPFLLPTPFAPFSHPPPPLLLSNVTMEHHCLFTFQLL